MTSKRKDKRKSTTGSMSRRKFLATGTGAASVFSIVPGYVVGANGQTPPSEKLNIAGIGFGGMGQGNIRGCMKENIVALCDVDSKYAWRMFNKFSKAARYVDYRVMLEKQKDIDAVIIATPDHTHVVITMAALQAGKHIYCQKPLTHTVYEARTITEAARQSKVQTQMGNQGHSSGPIRMVREWIQSGSIGDVKEVHAWTDRPTGGPHYANFAARALPTDFPAVPDSLNWDLWLGPAKEVAYDENRFHFQWRFWWNFGGGTLADFGCHYIDLPFWALDLVSPVVVEADGEKTYEGDNQVPDSLRVDYRFPARGAQPPVHLTWYQGSRCPTWIDAYGKRDGILFEGDAGRLLADYGTNKIYTNDGPPLEAPQPSIPSSIGHHQEWIAACKTRGPTTCNFDYSGALAEAVLLGNVSYRAGKRWLEWDAENLRATNCPEADQFIRREYRAGWTL